MCTHCSQPRPIDANYCSECGTLLLDYQTYTSQQESKQKELDQQDRRETIRKRLVLIIVFLLTLLCAWFLCLQPVIRSIRQAEQQAYLLNQRTSEFNLAFEDLDLRMKLTSYDADREFLGYAIYVRNRGSKKHTILASYTDCPSDHAPVGALDRECSDKPKATSTLNIEAQDTVEFDYGCSLAGNILPGVSITDMCGLRLRLDQIDTYFRKDTNRTNMYGPWDWKIGIFDKDSKIYPWFVDKNWKKTDPSDTDFDNPDKIIGE
jgi:hypothetical protein